jgi:capsular polysaccharide biosynthesis protein
VGPRQQPFPRPPPRTLDPTLLDAFSASFNLMQDVTATGDNLFTDVTDQFVATVPNGYVEGEGGLVYDAAGNVYHLPYYFHNRTNPQAAPLPGRTPEGAAAACTRRFPRLATVIQRYGHMYYHWLEETLPRVVALQQAGALGPGTTLLTWGQPYEAAWLRALGVPASQVAVYDPEAAHCAQEVVVPAPVPRVTPPREALAAVRSALRVTTLPPAQRDLVVYVSREGEPTRRVANEGALLGALRAAFPANPIVVFKGGVAPADAISLFQRSRVVVGPHGAGLAHSLFCAPGTAVVEFLFMADPPMMFWHTAAALRLDYWMVPLPQAFYMQREMDVPVGEVVDILARVLGPAPPAGACAPGTAGRPGGPCSPCPPGSYAYNAGSSACKLCPPGQVSPRQGGTFCAICQPGSYAGGDGAACEACPAGTHSALPGAPGPEQCTPPEDRRRRLEEQAVSVEMLTKLSPLFAKQMSRRALIQGSAGAAAAALSQQELCTAATAAGAMGDPYRGPYLMGDATGCPPAAPGTGTGVLLPPSPYGVGVPPPVVLPPIDPESPTPAQPPATAPRLPTVPPPTAPDPTNPPDDSGLKGDPEPPPPVPGKKVLDSWAIALIAVAVALVLIPLLFCCGKWCVTRRNRSKQVRAAAAAAAAAAGGAAAAAAVEPKGRAKVGRKTSKGKSARTGGEFASSNPMFNVNASTSSGQGA